MCLVRLRLAHGEETVGDDDDALRNEKGDRGGGSQGKMPRPVITSEREGEGDEVERLIIGMALLVAAISAMAGMVSAGQASKPEKQRWLTEDWPWRPGK